MRGTQPNRSEPRRRGMTLIELLVVIVLLTTLVTTAIPIISPGGEERKLREASRNVNAYLQGAQARAIQTGRPFGVAFRRLSADTDRPEDNAVCAQLRYVEVPPAYSGIDSASMARICTTGLNQLALQVVRYEDNNTQDNDSLPPGYDIEEIPDSFLRPGDEGEVNGYHFVILPFIEEVAIRDTLPLHEPGTPGAGYFDTTQLRGNVRAASWLIPIRLQNDEPQSLRLTHNWRGNELASPENLAQDDLFGGDSFGQSYLATTPAPFKIFRQPTLAGGEPLELSAGVAIDLQGSVFGDTTRVYRPEQDYDGSAFRLRDTDFMVLFSPEGRVHRVHGLYEQRSPDAIPELRDPMPVSGSIALLIGRRELIPAQPYNVSGSPSRQQYAEPIDLNSPPYSNLSEVDAIEVTNQYNWLNLESQWIVIGGQSGSVTSIDNSAVYGGATLAEQLGAALDNAPRRTASGGR